MSRVRIELVDAGRVSDLTRFLSVLAILGVDPDGAHPVQVATSPGGTTSMISAVIPVGSLPFDDDEEQS